MRIRKGTKTVNLFELSLEEMYSRLHDACGLMFDASTKNRKVREARDLVMSVELSIGELGGNNGNKVKTEG